MPVIEPLSQVGSDVIRTKAKQVRVPLGKADKQTLTDLIDTLRASELVGIAAPQIGRSVRMFLTEIRKTKFRNEGLDPLRVFINPTIVEYSTDYDLGFEGCGSVAHSDLFGQVFRAKRVRVQYSTEEGEEKDEWFEGFVARVIQHEFDHIEGVVFLDKLATTKTVKSSTEVKKL